MPKYIAFLRAINVGGHTVKMDNLRRLFEALGFTNVETFIASGNVIFDSSSRSSRALEKKIRTQLHDSLGYDVVTFVRSRDELSVIAKFEPFKRSDMDAEGSTLYIGFLEDSPGKTAKEKLLSAATEIDYFALSGREFFWLSRKSFSQSEFSGATLEKILGMHATLRNVNTVRKIAQKYC